METKHPSKIDLERYFAGDLPGEDAGRVSRHAEECAECGRALAELEAERRRFLNVHPFEDLALGRGSVQKRLPAVSTPKRFIGLAGAPWGAVAVVALLLMVVPVATVVYKSSPKDGIRYKGVSGISGASEEMSFLRMRDGEVKTGSVSDIFREGDRLQVVYSHAEKHFAALFSVDNNGVISFYTGEADGEGVCSIPADSGGGLTFPSSIVLDGARGEELVVMLVSDLPATAVGVREWVRKSSGDDYRDLSKIEDALRKNRLIPGARVSSMRIRKE
jgi:hypothetical protein